MSTDNSNSLKSRHDDSPARAQLVVVGTGIQWGGQTTLAAQGAIQQAEHVLFAVADPWAARWIRELCPHAEALEYQRDGRKRREIYRAMVQRILEVMTKGGRVCAVFYGCPAVLTQPAHDAIEAARAQGYTATMLPGVSFLDCLFVDLAIDPGNGGCHFLEASDYFLRNRSADTHSHLILSQVGLMGNRGAFNATTQNIVQKALGLLSQKLCQSYPKTHEVILYEAASQAVQPPRVERIALSALCNAVVSGVTTLYVPPLQHAKLNPARLAELTALYPPAGSKTLNVRQNQVTPFSEESP